MFYVIEHEYVGPNRKGLFRQTSMGSWVPRTQYVIQTTPGRTNMGNKEVVSGWLGTTNDNAQWALGEFESAEDARKKIDGATDAFRKMDTDSKEYEWFADCGVVEVYEEIPFDGFTEAWDPADWFDASADLFAGKGLAEAFAEAAADAMDEGVFLVGLREFLEERLAD